MIDWTRLNELKDEVGEDDFDEVVSLFLEEADEAVADLSPDQPESELEASFHSIKGSALNLGFEELAKICADAEKAAGIGDISSIDFEATRAVYSASKTALNDRLGLTKAA